MKRIYFVVIISIFVFMLGFSGIIYAQTINRTEVGYMYSKLEDVNEILETSGFKALPNHHIYSGTYSLFELGEMENLYIGISTSRSRTISRNYKNDIAVFSKSNFSGAVEYGFNITNDFEVTAGSSVGITVARFETRRQFDSNINAPILGILNPGNRVIMWKPYLTLAPYINLSVKFELISFDISAGYDFNVGISNWFDRMDSIENTEDVQNMFNSGRIAVGFSLLF